MQTSTPEMTKSDPLNKALARVETTERNSDDPLPALSMNDLSDRANTSFKFKPLGYRRQFGINE